MEILLVVFKTFFDKMVDCINIFKFKFILLSQSHNLQHFWFHNFLMINRFFSLIIVQLFESWFIILKMTFKFLCYKSILSPHLSLSIELVLRPPT